MKKLLIILFTLIIFTGCSTKDVKVLKYEQKTDSLVKNLVPLHVDFKKYESRYFMPWSIRKIGLTRQVASWANFAYKKENRYYGENSLVLELDEIKSLLDTTNFEKYNKQTSYALTTQNTQVRNLPTHKPFFRKMSLAGEGYPFDYMQNTRLHVNTPLFISHYSKDGSWAFVQSPVSTGWIPTRSFTVLNAKQRYEFKQNPKIIITTDNIPIYSNHQKYLLHVKIGTLFSVEKEDDDFYYSFIYTPFGNKIKARIEKNQATKGPLDFNEKNVLHVSSQLLGEKYGWGGFLGNRDCSAMTKDFLAPFGLWLPRNSAAQKDSGEYLSLKGLNDKEKEKMIKTHGIAFLSLIYLQGHIMLYAGTVDDKVMVMHNAWGLKTSSFGTEGRYVLGKSIISDLYIGENLSDLKRESLLISRVEGLVIKPDMPSYYVNPLVKAYPDIVSVKNNQVYFADQNSMEYNDFVDKTFQTKLDNPSIKDTLSLKYPAFEEIVPPNINDDPGRFRNDGLLKKLYGQNRKEIEKNLEKLVWVDGAQILFNKKQNASVQLKKVISELKTLPKKYDKFLTNIAGSYSFRYIKGTKRLSAHSYGIAIDLNVKQSRYWKWDKVYKYSNNFPKEIIDIFEKYGFIWGGRWYHYDTMHFEYRPELFDSVD